MNHIPGSILNPTEIYLGDNGAAYCGAHHGQSAQMTGRDISGQKVFHVTRAVLKSEGMLDDAPMMACESCGRLPS